MGLRVIAIDTGAEKKRLCKTLGAQIFVDFKESADVVKEVVAASGGQGVKTALVVSAAVSHRIRNIIYSHANR